MLEKARKFVNEYQKKSVELQQIYDLPHTNETAVKFRKLDDELHIMRREAVDMLINLIISGNLVEAEFLTLSDGSNGVWIKRGTLETLYVRADQ